MATSTTTLKKGDNLPSRGRSAKTLIIEMMREESLIDLSPKSTKEQAEKAFLKHIAVRAFNPTDPNSGMCLSLLTNNGFIPPDIANTFIQSIKAMIDIEEYTSLKERIEAIEKSLGLNNE